MALAGSAARRWGWASLALLERKLADHPLVTQLRFEPEALAVLPPRAPDDGPAEPVEAATPAGPAAAPT